jgi:hypothetical protein
MLSSNSSSHSSSGSVSERHSNKRGNSFSWNVEVVLHCFGRWIDNCNRFDKPAFLNPSEKDLIITLF